MSGDPIPAKARLRGVAAKAAPPGSSARAALRMARQLALDGVGYLPRARALWRLASEPAAAEPAYADWLARNRVSASQITAQIDASVAHPRPFVVEVVVVAPAGADADLLPRTLGSLTGQTWAGWRAVVVGPAGTAAGSDDRVRVVPAAGGAELAVAAGVLEDGDPADLVVVLEAGDLAEPDLVYQLVSRAWDDPRARVLHWDDDLLTAEGTLRDPRFRPSWSPDILFGANYLGRSFAVRREALLGAGGLRSELGDAAWWDLVLRLALGPDDVVRVPRVLTHLGRRPDDRPDGAVAVLEDHLERLGRSGRIEPGPAGLPRAVGPRRRPARHRHHPDPPQRRDAVALPPQPGRHRLPVVRRGRHGQRRAHPRGRGLVRRPLRGARPARALVGRAALQLLPGQQRGRGRRPGRGHRLPQRRHRHGVARLAHRDGRAGRCSPTSASWASS